MKTLSVRPVLIASKEQTNLWSYKGRKLYYNQANFNDEDESAYYRLVLISLDSNEKIEVGDTGFINIGGGTIGLISYDDKYKTWDLTTKDNIHYPFSSKEYIKKVIATQDQLSPEHINQLVAEYNNGGMHDFEIEMIETYDWSLGEDAINFPIGFKPKLINGFVTVVEKGHNIPCLEEPMEEDGELVYSDKRLGILNDPKINGVDYENTPIPDYPIVYTEEEVRRLLLKCQSEVLYPETYYEPMNSEEYNNETFLSEFNEWFNENKKK